MHKKFYVIKSLSNQYYYLIINYDKNNNENIIYAGGIKKKCIQIIINNEENSGNILMVQYNEKCCLKNLLKSGDEMVLFLKTILLFTIHYFPNILQYDIIDNSFILCSDKKRISLPDFYYVKYKKTWYEKNLEAFPSIKSIDFINLAKKNIRKNLKLKIMIDNDVPKEEILKEYLFDYFKMNMDCSNYQKIFNKYIGDNLQGYTWVIDKNTILNYNIKYISKRIKKNINHDNLNNIIQKLKKNVIKEQNQRGGFMKL